MKEIETGIELLAKLNQDELISAVHAAVKNLRDLEAEIREQASGSQDGYLLDVANRMRHEIKKLGSP